MSQLKKLLVALTPMGAAAYVAGGGTFASVGELVRWAEHPTQRAAVVTPAESTKGDPLWRTKKALLLMMAVGAAAYFGFSGTFANFQAETANNNSSIASGTLTLNNQVNTNSACFSYLAPSADNLNNGCDAAFGITNAAPGVFQNTQVAKITLTNSGSLDATSLYLYGSQVNGKTTSTLVQGATSITLAAPGLEGTIAPNDALQISYAGHVQALTATAAGAAGGATTIPIAAAPALGGFSYPAGATLVDTALATNTTASLTNCYDVKIPAATTFNFNPTAGNPFCSSVLMYVQEITGGNSYCWFGKGSILSNSDFTEDAAGKCIAPINVTTSGIPTGATVSIPLSAGVTLNGNIKNNDTITVTQGAHVQTFTANGAQTFGASSIVVNSLSNPTAFTTGAVVTDTSAQISLDQNASTDTVSQFQTAHHLAAGKLVMYPLTGSGPSARDQSGNPFLPHSASRTFYVGLYLPLVGASNQNALQGLSSTFGLTWHIDQ
jgi:hypothetical protein